MRMPGSGHIAAALAVGAALLGGCGGGDSDSATDGTDVVSIGVMTRGSVVVNGVRFEDNAATIEIDDTPKTAANLQDGMVVQVRGSVNSASLGGDRTGAADRVEAQIEVRGNVTSFNAAARPQSFVVLGQTVLVDDQTLFSNLAGFGAIAVGVHVEVHGLRDVSGNIRATRIEGSATAQPNGTGMANGLVDEIRGVVTNLTNVPVLQFRIGTQLVDAGAAQTLPVGAAFGNGDIVEVHCSVRPNCVVAGAFQASLIEVEDAEDSAFRPGQGERFEVEGLLSGFAGHPGTFQVAGISVTTTAGTTFKGGLAGDLGNGIKVEAEGTWNGSTLTARMIEFKRSVVRVQGTVTVSAAPNFTLDIHGRLVTVETNSFTSGAVPAVGPNCVQVRGERKAGGGAVVIAGEIDNSCSNSDRPMIQAPVEDEIPESTITLLGFVLNVSNPTDTPQFEDLNDGALSRTAFFNAVTAASAGPPAVAGTLVKVIFEENTNTVRQVELED